MPRLIETWLMKITARSAENSTEPAGEREFWMSRDPAERLAAVEFARQVYLDHDPATTKLQRVFTIHKLGED